MKPLLKRMWMINGAIIIGVIIGLLILMISKTDGWMLVLGVVGILLSGVLIFLPRLEKNYNNFSPWVKLALRIGTASTILWSVLVFLSLHFPLTVHASERGGFIVGNTLMVLSGFVVGIFTILFISGGIGKRPQDANRTELENSR
jgi:ABC-type iron transport system FetAB permease component